ncbi:histidine kinase/DNA gyrase B/HSP90-like ATPase [Dyadobacter jejuensis]|uniref:histidine kinase n=1 Tax=Dyadobacter jejuensis TaxID=1082580 RepID=A0A316AH96_9BACT|nr:sensor histidine kinase [Dyadobacter jejuensis]PWJ57156.1 histidine kinase/DNA gyrase B/HSP90-like ATPase [Dyadobacter jejuensis]
MQDIEELKFVLVIATLAMLLMAFFVISFVMLYQKKKFEAEKKLNEVEKGHNKRLLDTALDSEETERRRIAQDLHDDIGTMLSLTKLSLNQLNKIALESDSKERALIRKSQSLVEETILHVRRITRDLVPTTLERFGLSEAISEFINKLEADNQLKISFHSNADEFPRQQQKVELTLYRIMQELVNNAIKHAKCTFIEIELEVTTEFLFLRVTDNGIGFDAQQLKDSNMTGLGLLGIESRLAIINGIVRYVSPATGGSMAIAQIPVAPVTAGKPEPLHPYKRARIS